MALRREICERFIREPGYRFVELRRPAAGRSRADYRQAVADWHAARARVWARAIDDELADDGVGAFLAWGDPSLYDSTLRILDLVAGRIEFTTTSSPASPRSRRSPPGIASRSTRRRTGAHHHRPPAARRGAVGQRAW